MKKVVTAYAEFQFSPAYVVVIVKEGVDLGADKLESLISILNDHATNDFCWISDKQYSYSVNPTIVRPLLEAVPHFRAWCNVIYDIPWRDNYDLNKVVFPENFPLMSFNRLDDARSWAQSLVAK